jgi:tetratricopeptide (TPR) repeat protein
MGRYFDEVRTVLERHGGTVEKFIGDAVMAVFGIPQLHEDDALRAVRAAWDMREALARLNLTLEAELGVSIATRTGVNTGEVVAGDASSGQTLVTGDAVNVAARLEQAAAPGEILLGADTYRLVRDAVTAEPTEPLALKGKSDATNAYRLQDVTPEAPGTARRLDAPMVGRERELSLLQWAFDRAVSERTCHLATVLGAAGVGKSRLAEEFLHRLGGQATVLRGRCLPYGDGITFWAVVEVTHQAAGITDQDDPAEARAKLAALVEGEEHGERIAERVAQVLGLVSNHAVPEETLWAIRKLFESVARRKPLVLVFDDIHWAEPTFLDLIEHIADWSRDAPILLLAIGRLELLDLRPAWGGGKMNASTISLEPLSEAESEQLVENLLGRAELPAEAAKRIADAAEGNPLFVEEMVGMLIDDGLLRRDDGHWLPTRDLSTVTVPPTIQALLAARLDRLADEERQVIERASVVGRTFYRGAVTELAPEEIRPTVPTQLQALVRRELIRPQPSEFAGEDTFRFRHILIRDSAYEAMPKEIRADLHERFAEWLEAAAGERAREYEEILAYHLEQAFRFRSQLGLADERLAQVGMRAGRMLASAGQRADARGDRRGAVKLLTRAEALLPTDDPERVKLLPVLARSLLEMGEFGEAKRVAVEGADAAERTGDRAVGIQARQVLLLHRISTEPHVPFADVLAKAEHQVTEAESLGDQQMTLETRMFLASMTFWSGQAGRAFDIAQSAIGLLPPDDERASFWIRRAMGAPSIWGPLPVEEGIELWTAIKEEHPGTMGETAADGVLGPLLAMAGRFDEAFEAIGRFNRGLEEYGDLVTLSAGHHVAMVAMPAQQPERVVEVLRPGLERLRAMGETGFASTSAFMLAEALYRLGRYDEAEKAALDSKDLAAPDDYDSQSGWRRVLAAILARRGEHEEAERLAREAVAIVDPTDELWARGNSKLALAEVLAAAGRNEEAAPAAEAAAAEFERKGNVVMAGRARELLATLAAT